MAYHNQRLMTNSLYEAMVISDNRVLLDSSKPLNVLCIGNSITHHPPKKGDLPGADSLWRGDWGMCASQAKFDYVNRLEYKLLTINKSTKVYRRNIWEWENNLELDIDSLYHKIFLNKNLIILNVGENVTKENENTWEKAFPKLTEYCLQFTSNVIIVGGYWKAPEKEQVMISTARKFGLPYVPIFWIYENHYEEVIAHVGDTIYDRQGNTYTIPTEFICTHPNDEGMRMIAESILQKIKIK